MIRNILDSPLTVLLAILGFSALLQIWVRYRRGYSDRKAAALFLVVLCSAYFLLFLFIAIEPSLAAPAEIEGRVSRVDLRYPIGRTGDHSQFEVTSQNGLRVELDSEHHLAEGFRPGEALYVRYDPLTLDPYTVERVDGSNRQLLFENHPPRWMMPADLAMLALLAVVAIYHARKLRPAAS
jgi:hypothetical protein